MCIRFEITEMCIVCAFLYLLKNFCLKGINKLFITGIALHVDFVGFLYHLNGSQLNLKKLKHFFCLYFY